MGVWGWGAIEPDICPRPMSEPEGPRALGSQAQWTDSPYQLTGGIPALIFPKRHHENKQEKLDARSAQGCHPCRPADTVTRRAIKASALHEVTPRASITAQGWSTAQGRTAQGWITAQGRRAEAEWCDVGNHRDRVRFAEPAGSTCCRGTQQARALAAARWKTKVAPKCALQQGTVHASPFKIAAGAEPQQKRLKPW